MVGVPVVAVEVLAVVVEGAVVAVPAGLVALGALAGDVGGEAELPAETVPQPEASRGRTAISGTSARRICGGFAIASPTSCSSWPSRPRATICAMETTPTQAPRKHRSLSPLVMALDRLSPWWGPQLVVATALALDAALPPRLTIKPTWLLPSVEGALLLVLAVASPHPNLRHSPLRRRVAIGLIGLVSAVNVYSLVELVHFLLHHDVLNGRELIFSGILLWGTNVLLFGLWYYELDRGGPLTRLQGNERHADFLFVQMSADAARYAPEGWTPRLIDYLYTSLTNATAFSPTDTMPLSAPAKWLMAAQSLVSFATVGLIVARAVNIL